MSCSCLLWDLQILADPNALLQQPIIPSAHTIMEGRLLGGMETTFVARRTSLSAAVSCVGLLAAKQAGGQLLSVWLALLSYNLCAFACDVWCVQQRRLAESQTGRAACSVDFGDETALDADGAVQITTPEVTTVS